MKYMLMICNDGLFTSDPEEALIGDAMGDHIAATSDISFFGHPLEAPPLASTVRVRDGETLVADGPFAETKEYIAGFDLIECDTVERAVQAAGTHPLAWFNKVLVRPLADGDAWTEAVAERLEGGPAAGQERFMLFIHSDGVPTDAKREAMARELPAWVERMTEDGTLVARGRLDGGHSAMTVRIRGPHTLVSEEPYADAREFVAGFDVIDCAGREEAIAIAAAHPVASFHAVEVRPFTPGMCGEEPAQDDRLADVGSAAA